MLPLITQMPTKPPHLAPKKLPVLFHFHCFSSVAAYVGAVATSCAVAIGMNRYASRLNAHSFVGSLVKSLTPFAAVSLAGVVNVFLMRQKELL